MLLVFFTTFITYGWKQLYRELFPVEKQVTDLSNNLSNNVTSGETIVILAVS
jgi:hypothetical protein